jgi:uncharacterized protein (DUF1501 family)
MTISRREFLRVSSGALAATPPLGPNPPTGIQIVRLLGGADGLNLVPPVGDPGYARLRPSLAVRCALPLDGFFGLHPALAPLLPLYDSGELAVLHAAGFPRTRPSHFEAQQQLPRHLPCIDLPGWDTHSAQAARMPGLLARLATTLLALRRLRRTVIVLSEFGRAVRENAWGGTGHGYGQAVLMLGALPGGRVYARWPGLAAGHLPVTTDLTPYLFPGNSA